MIGSALLAEIEGTSSTIVPTSQQPPTLLQESDQTPTVKGRLKTHLRFWTEELGASKFVLNVIQNGYMLPFILTPPPCYLSNNKSSLAHPEFVQGEISKLLQNKCIVEHQNPTYCTNSLTVADNKKKLRLVLDLRHVNPYLKTKSFRYDDLSILSKIVSENDYMTTFDLTSGYHHVDIYPQHQMYLGFSWTFPDNRTRYFSFTVLVFGLSTACYLFTKMLRPLVRKWRSQGIRCVVYLDDGINLAPTSSECNRTTEVMTTDLDKSGLLINLSKSNLTPTQCTEWLGTSIDTRTMLFSVPSRKIEKFIMFASNVINSFGTTPRILNAITGKLQSMHLSIGPLVRLQTRCIYFDIAMHMPWDTTFVPSPKCISELCFWRDSISDRNGYPIKPIFKSSEILFTDASSTGYGGYLVTHYGQIICHGRFDLETQSGSSTLRELIAVESSLLSFIHLLSNQSISIRTDNHNTAKILVIGSPKPHLQEVAARIFSICLQKSICLFPAWIPREFNTVADMASKCSDTDDWSIDDENFQYIITHFGPCTIDRFASDSNKRFPKFNSKYHCVGTAAIDAFTQDWSLETNWISPPVSLIARSLEHSKSCRSHGILIAPFWPSSYFFPLIYDGNVFYSFIKRYLHFESSFKTNTQSNIFNSSVRMPMLAMVIDFS